MTYELIENLFEKLSCDFVLADSGEPESLSCLLPILKQIHGKCVELSLDGQARDSLKAKKIINAILKDNDLDIEREMTDLGELITDLLESSPHAPESDDSDTNLIEKKLDEFSNMIAGFCPGDIPELGAMLNCLDKLIEASTEEKFITFHEVCIACKKYIEHITLDDFNNTKPIEEGLVLLKSLLNHLRRGEAFVFDYSDVIGLLGTGFKEQNNITEDESSEEQAGTEFQDVQKTRLSEELSDKKNIPDRALSEKNLTENVPLKKILNDDMEILMDFVSESSDNLDTIEVNLVELEQDPSNKDIINEIFRPFHTIKGVSGFLSLTKINQLAHATENLLDSARSGYFLINDIATDAILASVDTLKELLARIRHGIETGFMPSDADIDVQSLRDKLQRLQVSLTKKFKAPLGEILLKNGDISAASLENALEIQKENPYKKIGEILVEKTSATPGQVADALMAQKNVPKKQVASHVKVSTQKLDDLVDYAGELVIAQSMLRQQTSNNPSLSQRVSHLGQIVTNMQNIAMSMRMIPIKTTFMKMIRIVRDLSRKSGKNIVLKMIGEDTEIDRNVVDALYDPMVHMIRNSCDHGIELPSYRQEQKKAPQGSINLRAYHKGGHIIIEIEDDGQGLDKEAILDKAKNTGLIAGNEQMTDEQVYDLILQPGFSTAEKITNVSGRGVGMDVVMEGIRKFRGQLNITSSKGRGTKFTISLPLTLAIIDGMLVGFDNEKYVIPTIAIQKIFKPDKKDCFTVGRKGEMVKDRGKLIPVIRLNEIYNTSSGKKIIWENLIVVVESKNEQRALVIDELLGKDEYVIKSLGKNLENVGGLAGGAILADGRVGLILDINGIFKLVPRE